MILNFLNYCHNVTYQVFLQSWCSVSGLMLFVRLFAVLVLRLRPDVVRQAICRVHEDGPSHDCYTFVDSFISFAYQKSLNYGKKTSSRPLTSETGHDVSKSLKTGLNFTISMFLHFKISRPTSSETLPKVKIKFKRNRSVSTHFVRETVPTRQWEIPHVLSKPNPTKCFDARASNVEQVHKENDRMGGFEWGYDTGKRLYNT